MATRTNKASKTSAKRTSKKQPPSDPSVSYDEWKFYEGQFYKGVKIGRGHKWYYDKGEWKDKKITPDIWQISYAVTKRRAGKAPEGSGAPVGTEYHWYIVAHQMVKKLNANDYTTSMSGLKFKVAHKRADTGKWSATPKTQRKRMIKFLESVMEDLHIQELTEETDTATKKKTSTTKKSSRSAGKKSAPKSTAKSFKPSADDHKKSKKTTRKRQAAAVTN